MFGNYRVVAVVPAGRRRYLEILLPYLRANRGILDECRLWCNTTDSADIDYMSGIASAEPFFSVVPSAIPVDGVRSIYPFFRDCKDPGSVYIRFDDDICWIAADCIVKLLHFRVANPDYFLVYANTINNNICSHLHQRLGCIGMEEGFCEYDAFGSISYASPGLAKLVHDTFLGRLKAGRTCEYEFSKWIAWNFDRISINCISWLGSEFAIFDGIVGEDEEAWLTQDRPRQINRPTAICGAAMAAHFAYEPQRPWLEANTSLLNQYKQLSLQAAGHA